jgi:hypothetical protein
MMIGYYQGVHFQSLSKETKPRSQSLWDELEAAREAGKEGGNWPQLPRTNSLWDKEAGEDGRNWYHKFGQKTVLNPPQEDEAVVEAEVKVEAGVEVEMGAAVEAGVKVEAGVEVEGGAAVEAGVDVGVEGVKRVDTGRVTGKV